MSQIMNIVTRNPPSTLYHYTDFNGLIGIVSKGEIWMGDLFFLNDEKEYLEGLQIFRTELEKRKKLHQNDSVIIFLNTLDSIETTLKDNAPFVFSLTEEADLLSQWLCYTNNGVGVNIGLTTSDILDTFKLFPCIYDRIEQVNYISHLFDLAIDKFKTTPETGMFDKNKCADNKSIMLQYWDALNVSASLLISTLNVACSIIKNASFKEEKEWRLISFVRSDVSFITRNTFLKPIKKTLLSDNKSIIHSIKVGPNPDGNLCKSSIQELLKYHFTHSVEISISNIPYRN